MTSKEVIAELQRIDPSGEGRVFVWDHVYTMPAEIEEGKIQQATEWHVHNSLPLDKPLKEAKDIIIE